MVVLNKETSFSSSYFDLMVLSPVACYIEICPYKYSGAVSEGTEQLLFTTTKHSLQNTSCPRTECFRISKPVFQVFCVSAVFVGWFYFVLRSNKTSEPI